MLRGECAGSIIHNKELVGFVSQYQPFISNEHGKKIISLRDILLDKKLPVSNPGGRRGADCYGQILFWRQQHRFMSISRRRCMNLDLSSFS
jgi:hypothetical protein